jgi:hypothetical protein
MPVSEFVFRSEHTFAVDGGDPVIRSANNAVTTHSWRIWEGEVELIMDISAGEQPVAAECPTLLVGGARFEAEVVPDEVPAGERIADLNVWNNTGLRKSNAMEEGAVQAHVECFAGTGGTVTAEFTVEMWVAFAT